MNTYTQGQIVRCQITVRSTVTKQAVMPSTLSFAYQVGTNASTTPVTWDGVTTQPAVGVIGNNLGLGRFECWIDTTLFAGEVQPQWEATGTGQLTADAEPFMVNPRSF